MSSILPLLERSLAARTAYMDQRHETAFRLFNGFLEGCPGLVMDVYASTLIIFNLAKPPDLLKTTIVEGSRFLQDHLPWLKAILMKTHHSPSLQDKCGCLQSGASGSVTFTVTVE